MIALSFQGDFINFDFPSLVEEIHPQGRSKNADLLFAPGFANRDTLVAAQNQNSFSVLDFLDDFFNRFFIGNNHKVRPLFLN